MSETKPLAQEAPTGAPEGAAERARVRAYLFGRVPSAPLPARARAAIDESERMSEILICWVQLGAVAVFGTLYFLTPKGFPAAVPFEPVPWALAGYALFTALRLALALRGALSRSFLIASIIVDVAVLMVTIWSFHLQYEQPASLYLKAPTLMYVFILIALRALRFDAMYVVLTGLFAAIGWLVLVLYAIWSGPVAVTRNFVEYMTSPAILIGAEVDKILSIAVVTAILAAAIMRGRALLRTAIVESQAANALSRFFSPDVANEIRATELGLAPGEGAVREACVLMIDLRGFTTLAASLDASITIQLLQSYHERMVPAIQRHGGAIDKYLGDGIMATFGATRASATSAADALRALEAVLAEADAWSRERQTAGAPFVEVGVAVTSGPLLFGVIGHSSRLEFTAIGDAVNLAAKIEKHTRVSGMTGLATRHAYEEACRTGYAPSGTVTRLDGQVVDGAGGPIDLIGFASPRPQIA